MFRNPVSNSYCVCIERYCYLLFLKMNSIVLMPMYLTYFMVLIGRINMVGWLFFVSIWHLVVYCPIAHLVWTPGGWFSSHHIRDFSGGIVVNVTGGVSAAAAHAVLGRRKISDTKVEPNAPNVIHFKQCTLTL